MFEDHSGFQNLGPVLKRLVSETVQVPVGSTVVTASCESEFDDAIA